MSKRQGDQKTIEKDKNKENQKGKKLQKPNLETTQLYTLTLESFMRSVLQGVSAQLHERPNI